jgi:sugar phosphate isomerase/epimerase
MKIALDPYMFRRVPLPGLPGQAADLGYQYLELSPARGFPAVPDPREASLHNLEMTRQYLAKYTGGRA